MLMGKAPGSNTRRRFIIATTTAGAGALLCPDIALNALMEPSIEAGRDLRKEHFNLFVKLHGMSSPVGWKGLLREAGASFAASPPAHGDHTIWEILLRMTGWLRDVRDCLNHGQPAPPWFRSWPQPVETSEGAWQTAIDELEVAYQEVIDATRRFPAYRMYDLPGGSALPGGREDSYAGLLYRVYACCLVTFLGIRTLIHGGRSTEIFLYLNASSEATPTATGDADRIKGATTRGHLSRGSRTDETDRSGRP